MRRFLLLLISAIMIILLFSVAFFNISFFLPVLQNEDKLKTHIPFGEITSSNNLVEEYEMKQDTTIDRIDILAATFQRKNTNVNFIELSENNIPFYSTEIDSIDIEDNSFISISGFHKKLRRGKILTITITSTDGTNGNAITVWINTRNPKNKLFRYNRVDGTLVEFRGELEIRFFQKIPYSKYLATRYFKSSRIYLYSILLTLLLIMYCLLYYMFLYKEENSEAHNSNPLL